MRVLLLGASGMVGGGALVECLEDDRVERVVALGRSSTGRTHPRLDEIVHRDLFDPRPIADRLGGLDACLYCLGVSSAGMSEAAYRRVTVELTEAILGAALEASPGLTICFVSGAGTDRDGASRMMWARVKGEAERYVLGLPTPAYVFRPGFIQPVKGVRSKTRMYRVLYAGLAPVVPLLRSVLPRALTTTEELGRAMLRVAVERPEQTTFEQRDIVELGRAI